MLTNLGRHVKTVRFYDVAANEQKSKFDHRAAVLAVAFSDESHAYSGGLDTSVRQCVYILSSPAYILLTVFDNETGWSWRPKRYTTWDSTMTPFPA